MKMHQQGFSTLTILLLIVLVGGIAGTGWYVWQDGRSQSHTSENRRLGDPSESESLLTTPDNLSLYLEGLPRRPIRDNEPRKP